MPDLKSALTVSLLAAALLAIAATKADAQRSGYWSGTDSNQWPVYSSAPFSREANERFMY